MDKCCTSCLATQTLFAKNAKNNNTRPWELVPDTNSSVKVNFIELIVMEPPQTLSHLSFAFKSTCYHEDIQTHGGAHPEGQVIWYPWSKRVWGGWVLLNNRPGKSWRSPEAIPPSPDHDKGHLFCIRCIYFKRNICKNTVIQRGQRGSQLGSKGLRWKEAWDRGEGHQEIWIALMKDADR